MTYELYQKELDMIYTLAPNPNDHIQSSPIEKRDNNQRIQEHLHRLVAAWLETDDVSDTADFFELGFDSLQATSMAKAINAYLAKSEQHLKPISAELIYAHASIVKLSSAIIALGEPRGSAGSLIKDRRQDMQELLSNHAMDAATTLTSPKRVFLLTGSTGLLGSYLLANMIGDPSISDIYYLNRGSDSAKRQRASHLKKNLDSNFEKVHVLECKLSDPFLGLEPYVYARLTSEVTHVIHNAWNVNFNLPITAFAADHIQGVRHIMYFCSKSTKAAFLFFISTD